MPGVAGGFVPGVLWVCTCGVGRVPGILVPWVGTGVGSTVTDEFTSVLVFDMGVGVSSGVGVGLGDAEGDGDAATVGVGEGVGLAPPR